MLDKETDIILFRVFNTLNAFENCETLDDYKRVNKYQIAECEMINSKDLREYFIKKYNIDIE